MTHRSRLAVALAQLLGPAPLAACVGGGSKDSDSGVELDDVACLSVDLGAACPDATTAGNQLLHTTTCESPVREVVATGAFLSSQDVVYTGYGGYYEYDTGYDTGSPYTAATRCCYEAAYVVHPDESCTIGRPLVVDGRPVSARSAPRGDWAGRVRPDARGLSERERADLAEAWTRAALLEHASIPAFARVALELVELGAPADLVARTAEAMRDEVRHADDCFALASAYAGAEVGPGALPAPRKRRASLRRLAVEAFREGCVGETLAVALAAAQLRGATDPAVRAVLERIVADEARHADLAWDTVRWAMAAGGRAVQRAVAREVRSLGVPTVRPGPVVVPHGLVDADAAERALRLVLDTVIAPSAAELLAA